LVAEADRGSQDSRLALSVAMLRATLRPFAVTKIAIAPLRSFVPMDRFSA
jgi:hypothetical protein